MIIIARESVGCTKILVHLIKIKKYIINKEEGKMDRCINKAISYVEDLIDLYDSNTEITDIDLCHIIEILKGRE